MKKLNKFLLAGVIFVELFLGIVVAPIIFFPSEIIGDGVLSHFQSGLLMTQIFIKFNYLLLFVSVFSVFYELFNNKLLSFRVILSVLILICACVFVFYYTDKILDFQALGESVIANSDFQKYHKHSEIIFKLMAILQSILFFTKQKEK